MLVEEIKGINPVDAFRRLRGLGGAFMLAGWDRGSHTYVSAGPVLTVRTEAGKTVIKSAGHEEVHQDPFAAVSSVLQRYGYKGTGRFPFNGGAAGYFAYTLKDVTEPQKMRYCKKDSPLMVPDCCVGFYDPLFVHDHASGQSLLISPSENRTRLAEFKGLLEGNTPPADEGIAPAGGFTSNMTREQYVEAILKAKEYIASGDIYQINLSQRLSMKWKGDGLDLFLSIVKTHPAPFSSFFDFGDFQVISNSPERLLRVEGRRAETSPIKGTRPRGRTRDEDLALIEELKASKKERAEHVMIVDLERNDLGRISKPGTVEVTGFEAVDSYPHLHHMISTVRGELRDGVDSTTALRALFPGGSVTGAPKIRAMEIIDELEPAPRDIYTGGIGWIDFNGGMDISMAIRTAVYSNGTIHLHVGGGIVADSDPEAEYEETLLKAGDFLNALGIRA